MKKQKGFTVLELLIVVAIIGILSAIVLGQVKTARERAKDKAIFENLQSARNEISIYYSTHGTYGTYGITGTAISTGNNSKCVSSLLATGTSVFTKSGDAQAEKTKEAIAASNSASNGTLVGTGTQRFSNTRCATNGASAAIAATLATDNTKSWCVDSAGFAGEVTGNAASSTAVLLYDLTNSTVRCNS